MRYNKVKHQEKYREAMAGYKESAIADLNLRIKRLRKCLKSMKSKDPQEFNLNDFDLWLGTPMPSPHDGTEDYERAIELFTWIKESEVEISVRDFDIYVRDRWFWTGEFSRVYEKYRKEKSNGKL